jgi:hypothetical protein
MKKIISTIVIAIFSIVSVSGQSVRPIKGDLISPIEIIKQDPNCQNYTTSSGWGYLYNYVPAPVFCPYLPLTSGLAANINILPGASGFDTSCSNVSPGYINFNNVAGAHQNRQVKALGTAYDKNFQMDFNLNVASTQTGNGFYPVLLSSNNEDPNYSAFSPTFCPVPTTMDELIISVNTPSPSSASNPTLRVIVRDNGVNIVNTVSYILTYGTPYYSTVKVYGNEKAEIQIFSNCKKTNLLYKQCFDFPKTVNALTFLQHSINSGGGFTRRSSGKVADVCIKKVEYDCCKMSLSGKTVICDASSTGGPSETYSVFAGSDVSNVVISVTGGVSYVVNLDGSITITNWGTFTTAPKIVTITARGICQCKEIEETLTVYVHPKLNPTFNFSGLGNTGLNLNNFTLIPVATPMVGVVHQWEIYNSDAIGSQFALVRGPYWNAGTPLLINSSFISLAQPQLLAGQFYMVKHGMYFTNGLCGWTEKRGLIYVFSASRMTFIPEDENGNFDKKNIQNHIKEFERQVKSEATESIEIAPNPVIDYLNINTSHSLISYQIYNSLGQLVLSNDKQEKEINVSNLEAGQYFIKIETETSSNNLKFIKR